MQQPWLPGQLVRALYHLDTDGNLLSVVVEINKAAIALYNDLPVKEVTDFLKRLVAKAVSANLCSSCRTKIADGLKAISDYLKEKNVPKELWGTAPGLDPLSVGIAEGIKDEGIAGFLDFLELLFRISSSEQDALQLIEGLSALFDTDTLKKVLNNAWENKKGKYLDENGELKLSEEELMHELGKDVGGLVAMLLEELLTVGSGTTARAGKMFTKEVWEEFGEQAVRQARQLLTSLNKRAFDAAEKLLGRKALAKLADDIGDAVDSPLARALNEKPELVKAWKVLDDAGVDEAIRKSPLHVEATKKLDDLKLDTNPSEANKLIKNINEGLAQAGDKGKHVAKKIKDGTYEGVEGYKDLLKQIKKSNDVQPSLNNSVIPVKQAMDKFDMFPNEPKGNKFFEKGKINPDGTQDYDIDFGIKDANGNIKIGYQLKKANNPTSAKNALKDNSIKQIDNSPALDKRFEIELLDGAHSSLTGNSEFMSRLNTMKQRYSNVKFFVNAGGSVQQY